MKKKFLKCPICKKPALGDRKKIPTFRFVQNVAELSIWVPGWMRNTSSKAMDHFLTQTTKKMF
tara:strand:- start:502 stop:690 length:189 start_codon:yes stop_codon:yes gene_type:complete